MSAWKLLVLKKNLVRAGYQKEKLRDAAAKALLPSVIPTQIDDGCKIIEQLKEKFHSNTDSSQQLTILTILPKVRVYKKSKKNLEWVTTVYGTQGKVAC